MKKFMNKHFAIIFGTLVGVSMGVFMIVILLITNNFKSGVC